MNLANLIIHYIPLKMKAITHVKWNLNFGMIALLVFLLGSCSGYYTSIPADGIYGYRQIEIQHAPSPNHPKSSFYKNYFNNLSEQESFSYDDRTPLRDSIYTDLEDDSHIQGYQTYGPWGQSNSTTRIIINNYYPHDYAFGFGFYNRPWGFGFRPFYGYRNRLFFPYSRRFHHPWNHHWHYPTFAYNPHLGYEYGYSSFWSPSPYHYWNPYPYYGHGWGYPLAYRNYQAEGYSGVSYVRNRRNQPIPSTESQNRKTRKGKESRNTSKASNSLSTQLALSRLQSSLATPRYYGSQSPRLTRSGSVGSDVGTSQRNSGSTNLVTSRTQSGSTNLAHSRQTIQRKSRVNPPRYQVSTSKRSQESSVDSPRKSNVHSNTRYRQPRTTRSYRSNDEPNQRTTSSVKRTYTRSSSSTNSIQSNYRSPSKSTYRRSNHDATRTRYSQPRTSRTYQNNNASYRSSSRSSSVSRSQSKQSNYSSSRSSSSNSRGRSSSSSRRN